MSDRDQEPIDAEYEEVEPKKKPAFRRTRRRVAKMVDLETIKTGAGFVEEGYHKAFSSSQGKPSRQESFAQAVARLGLSEADLQEKQRFFGFSAWIYFVSACGIGAYGAWRLIQATDNFNMITGFCTIVIASLFVALAARSAFRHWQIRIRRLASFGIWVRQPSQWFPR